MNSIGTILSRLARERPQAIAFLACDASQPAAAAKPVTYAELETRVARAAGWLKAQGLRRGQAVLVFVPMSLDLYVALLAMFRLGVVALFLDPSAGKEHMERCCARWQPDALLAISKAHLLRLKSAALRRIPKKFYVGTWVPLATRWLGGGMYPTVSDNVAQPGDAALVTFTSGSTGVPKGAVRTHGFLLAQYEALAPSIKLQAGEIDFATLPVFTLANLAAGVTTLLTSLDLRKPGEIDARAVFDLVDRHRVTRITASPAFFERLIAFGEAHRRTLESLTKLYTGGAPVFPRLLRALEKLAPRAEVVAVYGSTEAEPICHIETHEITEKDIHAMTAGRGLLAGIPVKEVKLRVLKDRWGQPRAPLSAAQLEEESVSPNQAGEIVVSGDHVLTGYLGGMGNEETKFRVNGTVWHRTGDAGLFDDEGRLWLLGRCAARIEDADGTLYPFGVECAVTTFSEIRRSAATVHDGKRVLVVESSNPAPDLVAKIKATVSWAQIAEVHVVEKIPVDARHNAKIDYTQLKAMLQTL